MKKARNRVLAAAMAVILGVSSVPFGVSAAATETTVADPQTVEGGQRS
jgi:hypothetical protein